VTGRGGASVPVAALRAVLLALGVAAAAAVPTAAVAQPAAKLPRIGYLGSGSLASGFQASFVEGLRELGWIDGKTVAIEWRFAEGRFDRLPLLAAELVRGDADVIVAQPTPAAIAAKEATATVPVVFVNVGDPERIGLVASLAKPGGNVTGVAFDVGLATFTKGLELFREAVPALRRVAVLTNPANPAQAVAVRNLAAAAESLGLQLVTFEVRGPQDLDRTFAEIARTRADGVFVVAESLFLQHRARLAELVRKSRLPSLFGIREHVDAGGLMSYGPSLNANSRRAAVYVDRILRGAKPADLPVEQPTKFDLVVNLATARALGLTIPAQVLRRADELIR